MENNRLSSNIVFIFRSLQMIDNSYGDLTKSGIILY